MSDLTSLHELLCVAFIALLGFILLLNIFGLPANWIILGLDGLWAYFVPNQGFSFWFWLIIIGLALAGELAEMGLQVHQGKKYGSSTSGNLAGIFGAIVGAILLAPVFWGLGAFIGALIGAWTGCFIIEILSGKQREQAMSAAFGAMIGKFLGTILKIGIGAIIIAFTAKAIWPANLEPFLPAQAQLPLMQSFITAFAYAIN